MRACITTFAGLLSLISCGGAEHEAMPDTTGMDSAAAATAPDAGVSFVVRDSGGYELGVLSMFELNREIVIAGRLVGLPPGEHGVHVHTVGWCDLPTFEAAGAHWNPTQRQHGSQHPQGPHLGDLPNVVVGADSAADIQLAMASGVSLRTGANTVIDTDGATVIIHSAPDDYRTDPSGGSGARIACGVISASEVFRYSRLSQGAGGSVRRAARGVNARLSRRAVASVARQR